MNFTQLRYFLSIAKHGSMTAAAKALHISQPTLSISLQQLEQNLETTLFLRDRRGARLTEPGKELLRYAERILQLTEEAERQLHELEHEFVGTFTIGCPDVLGAYFLPSFLGPFMEAYPHITIQLWNAGSPDVYEAILARDLDYGIVVNPFPHPDLVLLPLFTDKTSLFIATPTTQPTQPEAEARLRKGPLLFVDKLPQTRTLLEHLASRDLLSKQQLGCGTYELVKALALSGLGVAIIPERVAAYGQEGKLSPLHIELPFVPDTIYLIYRGDAHRTQAAKALQQALLQHGRDMDTSNTYTKA